jgi:hypothetical protein
MPVQVINSIESEGRTKAGSALTGAGRSMNKLPPNALRLVFLFWVLVAFFYFYLSYDFVKTSMNDSDFSDYLTYVVRIAGNEHRPAREIRALLLVRAEELGLPIRGDQITILGAGQSLKVAVNYEVDIEVPVFERGLYRKSFQHNAAYSSPN